MTHTEKAMELLGQKIDCSQAVLAAFAEELQITEEQALKVGGCFGGGMFKGEVCGACTGALMTLGLKYGQTSVEDMDGKAKTATAAIEFLDTFAKENGSCVCKQLLNCDLSTEEGKTYAVENNLFAELCPKFVASAIKILEKMMEESALGGSKNE